MKSCDDPARRGHRGSLITRLEVGAVVVAIDLGEGSTALAAFGAGLARALGATPVFVHVVARDSAPAGWQPAVEAHHRSALDRAREELTRLGTQTSDGTAEIVVSPGHPAEEIAALATARRAGLIVMGRTGQTGLFGARPGSNAYRVLLLTPTSVLVVPPATLQANA